MKILVLCAACLGLVSNALAQTSTALADVRVNGDVRAIQPMGDGTFIVGGSVAYYNGTRITQLLRVQSDGTRVAFPVTVEGLVSAMALDGNWLYLGGEFQVVNNTNLPFVARVDATTGAVDATWRPAPNGDTVDMAVAPGGLVLSGAFSRVGGLPRSQVALIATSGPSSGRAVEAWKCDADGQVDSVVVNAGKIYLGGHFKKLNSTVIQYLARVDAATGTVEPSWNPTPQFHVYDLATDGTHLYCAGSFTRMGSGGPSYLTRLTLASGSVDQSWSPSPDGFVTDIAISGDSVYASGFWLTFGGVSHRFIGRVIKATGVGDPSWVPPVDGAVFALAADGSSGVWAGGRFDSGGTGSGFAHFTNAQGSTAPTYPGRVEEQGVVKTIKPEPAGGWFVGGTFDSVNGVRKHGLFRLQSSRTLDTAWSAPIAGYNPGVNAMAIIPDALGGAEVQIAGQFDTFVSGSWRYNCLRLKTGTGAVQTGFSPQPDNEVFAMVRQGNLWVIGGSFDHVGPYTLQHLARFDDGGLADGGWKPTPNGDVRCLLVQGDDLYVGGDFTLFGQAPNFYQAKHLVRVQNMEPDVAWQPQPNDAVFTLATDGSSIFAGGRFTKMARAKQRYLAQLPLGGAGTPTAWNPNPNGAIYALSHTGSYLYVGGVHTTIANYVWRKLTRFHAADLSIDTTYQSAGDNGGYVAAIEPQTDGSLFVGGSFDSWDNDTAKRSLVRIVETGGAPAPFAGTPQSSGDGDAESSGGNASASPPPPPSQAPANDNFANATVQTGEFWLATGTLHGATSEPNEPVLTYMPNGATVWWQWTSTSTGSVRFRTWGSEQANMLAIYRGASIDTLRLVASDTSTDGRENSAEVAFSATAGETYYIQVLGADFANALQIDAPILPGRIQLSMVPYRSGAFTPTNDAFASAATVTGASADILVCNTNATSQTGEPLDLPGAAGDSVWVQWTAPSAGVWSLSSRRTDFDNLLAVYTGTAVNALTRVNYSDYPLDALGQNESNRGAVRFKATAGQVFRFQVMSNLLGGTDEYGVCRLILQPATAPANDDFANAQLLTGASPTGDGNATYATREAGEPGSLGDETGSAWWTWTPPTSGLLQIIALHGDVVPYTGSSLGTLTPLTTDSRNGTRPSTGAGWGSDGLTAWYRATAGVPIKLQGFGDRVTFTFQLLSYLPNDDFANRAQLSGANASVTVNLLAASLEPSEPTGETTNQRSVWYSWKAPSTGRFCVDTAGSQNLRMVNVYTGTALASLTRVSSVKYLGLGNAAVGRVYFNAVSGTTYAIQLCQTSVFGGPTKLNLRPAPTPANDNFASAAVKSGSAWTATGTNLDATIETNEPLPAQSGANPNSSVWWRWTAPASGLFRLSTAGSAIDSVLSVYTGTALGALTTVVEDQSAGWRSSGAVNFNATKNTVYQIRVDGQLNTEGAIKLSLQPAVAPPNDAFASRLKLSGVTTTATGNVLSATLETGETNFSAPNGGHSVWFEWTAPASGTAFFRVTADKFSPAVGIYFGSTLTTLSPAITGGSGAPTTTAQTFLNSYPVSSGTSYKIRVDGAPASNGNFQINVSMPAPPVNDAFANRLKLTGAVVRAVTNNEGATAQPGEPAHAGTAAAFSVWHEWTATDTGNVTIDTVGNTGRPRIAVYTGTALNALTPIASDATTGNETFANVTFAATAGVTYIIAVDSTSGSRGTVPLNIVSAGAVPANDAFAGATAITTDEAETLVEWRGVSAESGEPAHGGRAAARSLWWTWSPITSRRARLWFETQDASLLARIAVYQGTSLGSLTPIAATTSDTRWSRLDVDVNAGETYYIAIDSPSVASLPGWIRWGIAPVNGTADQAYLIDPTDGVVDTDTTGAFTTDLTKSPTGQRELWYAWTPEVCARMEWRAFAPPGSGISLAIATASSSASFTNSGYSSPSMPVPGSGEIVKTFDVEPDVTYFLMISMPVAGPVSVQLAEADRQPPPDNDLEYRAMSMAGASWTLPVTLGAETANRQFWTWTAPSAGVAEVTLDGQLADTDRLLAYAENLSAFSAGASRTNGGAPVLRLASTAGTRWRIVTETSLRRLRATTLSLVSPATGTPPSNDSWTTAQLLAPSWSSVTGDVTLASCQPGEQDHSDSGGTGVATIFPPGRSVWYDWVPAASGNVTLRLDSTTDLAMRVYYGPALTQWFPIQTVQPGEHRLSFFAKAGESYHIAVATRPPFETTAPFTLRFGGPPNDLLAGAIVLTGASATSSVNSAGASTEDGEPGYGFNFEMPRASLWWKWTAPSTGSVWIDTRGSEFDTVLTVFGTDPPETNSRIAENDNLSTRPGITASAVRFATKAGQTYFIRLCRRDAAEPSGVARLNLSTTAPLDPYASWIAGYPSLKGADALETADPDNDGLSNLAELALGTSPTDADPSGSINRPPTKTASGWQVEAALDLDALESIGEGTSLEVYWQTSLDQQNWQSAPAEFVQRQGSLFLERLTLPLDTTPYVRLLIRQARTSGSSVPVETIVNFAFVPQMHIQGNGVEINLADATPSTADHTDFGSAHLTGGSVVRTFTIANTGAAALNLTGTPKVVISGPQAADFSVTTQPTSPVAALTGTTTFDITFDPSALGIRTATVSVANDDSNKAPYTFTIQGRGFENLGGIDDVSVVQDTATTGPLSFSVGVVGTLSATSSNTTLLPNANITLGGSGATRTITLAPVAGQFGTATITVTDSLSGESSSFLLTVRNFGRFDFEPTGYTVMEGGKAMLTINRNVGTGGSAQVTVATSTASVSPATLATVVKDYEANTQTLTFADGEFSKTFEVQTLTDALAEGNETFLVKLSAPTGGASLGSAATARVTIIDASSQTTDAIAPVVTLTTPAVNALVGVNTGGTTNLIGTATDAKGVEKVEYRVLTAGAAPSAFTLAVLGTPGGTSTTFTAPITPVTGTNTVEVKATDYKGNTKSLTRSFIVTRPLQVLVVGTGTVSTGFAGTSFRQVGKPLTIKATPGSGKVFDGWSVNSSAGTGITPAMLELPTLTFNFAEGLIITTKFITNPFTADVIGTFNGLVSPSAALPSPGGTAASNESVGLLQNAKVQSNGSFTSTLKMDGLSKPVNGTFDNTGVARFGSTRSTTYSIARTGKPALDVTLQLDMTATTHKITGTVSQTNASNLVAHSTIDADRAHYSSTLPLLAALVKPYTLVFPSKAVQPTGITAPNYPQGHGYATMSVSASGSVSIVGKLADNTSLSASAPLSSTNQWPIFAQLYGLKGCFAGMATLADANASTADVTGTDLRWFRPFQSVQWYRNGWSNGIVVDVSGARYVVPPATPATSVFPLITGTDADGNASLTFSDGLLATSPLSFDLNISTANVATRVAAATLPTLTITKTSGLINGSFAHSDGTTPAYQGVIIQKGVKQGGWGYFMTRSTPVNFLGESGAVHLLAK